MLSQTCKTAIKAVVYLTSIHEAGQRAGMQEIAAYIDASQHTVGKLLQVLVKDGVINSVKGPNGGFYITRRQCDQPLIKIVESIDGKDVFRKCGLGLSRCSEKHPCPVHDEYKKVRELFEKLCREKRISDLSSAVEDGIAYLAG